MAGARVCVLPVRAFLQEVVEAILRLFGPATVAQTLRLGSEAELHMENLHNFLESQKLLHQHRAEMRDYLAKHSQWIGSHAALQHVEAEAIRYLGFQQEVRDCQHRVNDSRGDPWAPPTVNL